MYRHGSELRRAVNDEIVRLAYATVPLRADEQWVFLCECGNTQCHRQVPLRLEEFDAARLSDDAILATAHLPLVLQTWRVTGVASTIPLSGDGRHALSS